nr:MAG: RNA-dependent RNA polymerase [Porcine picobirnavirus]
MKTKLTDSELATIQANSQLRRYLESLLKGKPATPRSWLFDERNGNLTPDEVLDRWMKQLQNLENGSEFEQNVFQFDTSQLEKWGPQGAVPPIEDIMDIVEQGFGSSPIPKAFESDDWAAAKRDLTKLLTSKVSALRPASYQHVVDDMRARDTLESNSGWPLFTRRSKPEVKEASIRDAESGSWRDYPAIALFRNYNQKTRLVWMFPMSANLVEGSYFQPLQSRLMQSGFSFLAPWEGFESVRKSVNDAYAAGRFVAASDFSSTDAHFTLHSTLEVFDVIQYCFQAKYRDGLRDSLVHMHEIPLVIGPDSKMVGSHGVSSGSNWTNFIETIFDWILAFYVKRKLGAAGYSGLYAIGDDMSWVSDIYVEDFAKSLERIGESVGQVVKSEKTTNDRDKVKSLQRLFQRGYSNSSGQIRGVYSTIRALKSSVYPERFHDPRRWNSDMFCARQFMILENCVDHPLFEDFVKFVCSGQSDLIPFAKQSDARLSKVTRETKLLPGLNPTYNQEKRDSSLAEFASIQIARNL